MIMDEDYIQTDGLIAENEHLHKIITEQDKEIEKLKKNWNKLKKLVKDNIQECYKLKTECIHKASKDCYGIVENREEVFAFIYSSMIEVEDGDPLYTKYKTKEGDDANE